MKLNYKECLLIEDIHIDQEIVKHKFKVHYPNISVKKVPNGKEAIDFLQGRLDTGLAIPFLIIVDINMPSVNGFQFLEECKKMGFSKTNKPKIAMLTSSLHPSDEQRAKHIGIVDDYIIKPIDMSRIEQLMPFLV